MASTFTTSLQIQKIGTGEQSGVWGATTNTNWDLIEQAVAGVQNITMLNADYTLTVVNGASDEARNMVIVAGGTNSAIRKIIAPLAPKVYIVNNNTSGGYAITIGGVSGSVVTIPTATTLTVYCDGTNFYTGSSGAAGNFNIPGDETVGGNLSVVGNLTVSGITNVLPAGIIQMWPTASAPTGFLICNGAAVSRSTYATLFAAIGTAFGSGDGSTTFNIPNYQGRMPIGANGSYTLASTGGSTTISASNLPSHTHTFSGTTGSMNSNASHSHSINDPGHSHTYQYLFNQGLQSNSNIAYSGGIGSTGSSTTGISVNAANTDHTHNFSGTTAATGSGTDFITPYLGINFIIKT